MIEVSIVDRMQVFWDCKQNLLKLIDGEIKVQKSINVRFSYSELNKS